MTRERRTGTARRLRQKDSLAEARVWSMVRSGRLDGLKFRREHPVGPYFVDFACEKLQLVIEIDGKVHELDDVVLNDHLRQEEIETLGWTVLRFTNEQVLGEPHLLTDAVRQHAKLAGPVPHPPTDFVGGPLPLPPGEG